MPYVCLQPLDPSGNLVAQTQTIGSQTHTFSGVYNPADWPRQATNDALSSSTTGDGGGNVLSQRIQNGGGTLTYNTDQTGRQNQIGVLALGGTTPLTTTLSFNNNEQQTGILLPNDVEQDAGYTTANQLSTLTAINNASHAALNTSYQYGYDPLALTTSITTTVQGTPSTQTLTHDAARRLTASSGGAAASYGGRGNLTSATASPCTDIRIFPPRPICPSPLAHTPTAPPSTPLSAPILP